MSSITIGLIGNPNCGKTTLFNSLTGARQIVGNWPGVTVERKTGAFHYEQTEFNIVDLPGTYSLTSISPDSALDEQIACRFILSQQANIIINVIDAANLERNLYLTTQLLAMQVPMIIALNMIDVAERQRLTLNCKVLAEQLGCPVIPIASNKGVGILQLKAALASLSRQPSLPRYSLQLPMLITTAIQELQTQLSESPVNSQYLATALLENDNYARSLVTPEIIYNAQHWQAKITAELEEPDIIIADARYGFIHQLCQQVLQRPAASSHITSRLDRIVLNRFLGIPIFLGIMYLMFAFAINIGGAFQDFFDITTDALFVQGGREILHTLGAPAWLTAMIANGIGKGINTTATFIPIIGAMFLFLSLLEDSGYMARAAFVMDRLMRTMGLPGKSFVPMIIGFGCNVPAIMAARTLESKRDRVLTIIMSPFMSCGARLTIFALFSAAFFAQGSASIVFALYLVGIAAALLTGFILRKTVLQGKPEPFVMELPLYHRPNLQTIARQTWSRLKHFIVNAGKIIIPVCAVIVLLNSLTLNGRLMTASSTEYSMLAALGQILTPLFAPIGLTTDNWPATVALLTGTVAKEVVVATLNTLYSQMGDVQIAASAAGFSLWDNLVNACMTIPANLGALSQALYNPIAATIKDQTLSSAAFGMMYQHFDGKNGAFAYLLFILLYVPCVSTTAVIARELNKQWALFSVLWSAALAYGLATVFYQLASFTKHPGSSITAISAVLILFALTVLMLHVYAQKQTFPPLLEKGAAP